MKNPKYTHIGALLFISILFVSYSCVSGITATSYVPNIPKKWTKITPQPIHFMGRDLLPSCSGFPSTNPTFSFFVKGGKVNNLVIYFEAGGACWDAFSCLSTNKIYKTDVNESNLPNHLKGMFDLSHPSNPFKDWTFVFIPYCTGDVHCGSKDMIYENQQGEKRIIHHRGHDNFLTVLKWVTDNITNPHKIFITGSSAGSLGAIGNAAWIIKAYPKSKVYILGDGGMEVAPKELMTYRNDVWNVQTPKWIFGENPPFPISISDLWKAIAKYYPDVKLAEFINAWDMTLIYFYDLGLRTVNLHPGRGNVCADWHARMLVSVDEKIKATNYRIYMAPGTQHTIMTSHHFYTEATAGISFLDWLNAMIDHEEDVLGNRSVLWQNVKCIECDRPPICRN